MKTTTKMMNWVCLLLLLPAGNALVEPHRTTRTPTESSKVGPLHMHMSFPSLGGFRLPVASKQKKTKPTQELWYRDRSTAEEQMTTQPPDLATTATMTSRAVPAKKLHDWNPLGAVNLSMVQETCSSHASLLLVGTTVLSLALALNPASNNALDFGSLHWNGCAFHSLTDWSMTPLRISQGILATIPLVTLSTAMAQSEEWMCPIQNSLMNTVLSLFGRRAEHDVRGTHPLTVLLVSLAIASVSALSEELVFRGLLPTALESYSHSIELALVGQALLFGLGQIRRNSSMAENGVFSLMQSLNGLWYGMVYLGTGGDLLPVLVAHVLYECHVFVGGWKMINDQLDYTQQTEVTPSEQVELNALEQEAGGNLQPQVLDHCRKFFYAFDVDHKGSLSRSDVKRAVAYAFSQDGPVIQPSDARTNAVFDQVVQRRGPAGTSQGEGNDRIGLSEFLHLLFALKSQPFQNQVA